jgi:hypothetical protein
MTPIRSFWNAHQAKQADWDFAFNKNISLFLNKAAAHGLFVNFRIGPYVCAEYNYVSASCAETVINLDALPRPVGRLPGLAEQHTGAGEPLVIGGVGAAVRRLLSEDRGPVPRLLCRPRRAHRPGAGGHSRVLSWLVILVSLESSFEC